MAYSAKHMGNNTYGISWVELIWAETMMDVILGLCNITSRDFLGELEEWYQTATESAASCSQSVRCLILGPLANWLERY